MFIIQDDIPPRYVDVDARHSRARLDYDLGPSQYGESYGDRYVLILSVDIVVYLCLQFLCDMCMSLFLTSHVYFRIPRSSLGYGSSRSAMPSHDSRGPYSSSRQGMEYGGGLIENFLLWFNI